MIYDLRRMIYLRCKYDIISVPSYAKGIYHPPQVDIISKIYHPFRQERISLKNDKFLSKLVVFHGGRWWIRTTEVSDNRFTVCPLWPLGKSPIFNLSINGAGGRTRTPDLLITNQLLYQLSYTSKFLRNDK